MKVECPKNGLSKILNIGLTGDEVKVKLIRHTFPDAEDWIIVDINVPLGTLYEVIGYDRNMSIIDINTGRKKHVECYLLDGNGDVRFLPTCIFEQVE